MSSFFLVLVRPYDDPKYTPDVWMIRGMDNEGRRKKFAMHFENAKEQAVKKSPDEWNLDDIKRILQKRWDITSFPEAEVVTY